MNKSKKVKDALKLFYAEWRTVLATQWLLPRVSRRLRRGGLRETLAWAAEAGRGGVVVPGDGDRDVRVVARAVNLSGRYGPFRGACLARSVVLSRLLHRRGIAHEVVIGADWRGQGLQAHAWVEMAGEVVNDDPDIRSRFGVFEADS